MLRSCSAFAVILMHASNAALECQRNEPIFLVGIIQDGDVNPEGELAGEARNSVG